MMKKVFLTVVATFVCCSMYSQMISGETLKIARTFSLIDGYYVDSTNLSKLTENMITNLLKELDPHSTYISAEDVAEMNESLEGNFDGIGIQFNILHDTVIVVEPIAGGPSEKVGLRAGDRIVNIDSENVAGINISTTEVRKRLMGEKGTKVNVGIVRKDEKELLDFTITRDKIPIESLDAAYMITKDVGYFRFNKFAATTAQEFNDAILRLKEEGLKDVIIDLRSNGGGVMSGAIDMADHFFPDNKLMVYMEGRKTPRQNFISNGAGNLSDARLVVLINESSASASEIFTGAVQDWDRGVVVGRRTFGKGLVQGQFYLTDGSMIRLTVARYYTPTGRSIQSPYDEGYDKYVENYNKRFLDGELVSSSALSLPDSLKYNTLINNRVVYGGGGIVPDVFVPVDTVNYTDYYGALSRKGVYNSFVLEYADKNRIDIKSKYPDIHTFKAKFAFSESDIKDFIAAGEKAGVKYVDSEFNTSKSEILLILKALVANHLWQVNEYYMIVNDSDPTIDAALEVLAHKKEYNSILGNK